MSNEAESYLGRGNCRAYGFRELLARIAWSIAQSTVFRWSPRSLHVIRAYLLKCFGATIPQPSQVTIYPTVTVTCPWNLILEPHAVVGANVTLYCLDKVRLRRGATVSQNCHLCTGTHDFRQWTMPLITAPIVVGQNAWIAADAFLGPGVTIGELCVVGARSVVVRSLPDRTLCVGHPCRPIKKRVPPQ